MGQMRADQREVVVGVDIGGTSTRVALARVADDQPPQPQPVAIFATNPSYSAQLARVAEAVYEATAQARRLGLAAPAGVGVSFGGRIAADGSGVAVAPNLRDYEGHSFVQQLSGACGGLPVRLAHDAVCGLLAERQAGALTDAERCAYLTLSTGTGCAIHLERAGGAGVTLSIEMGHQLLDHNDRVCLCGQIGCLETYTGGRQLALRYGQPIETLGEPEASEMWRAFVEKLSLGLVNLGRLTRVERVAIGGAIALHHPDLLGALQAAVDDRLRGASLALVEAHWGADAPMIGAAALLTTPERDILH